MNPYYSGSNLEFTFHFLKDMGVKGFVCMYVPMCIPACIPLVLCHMYTWVRNKSREGGSFGSLLAVVFLHLEEA